MSFDLMAMVLEIEAELTATEKWVLFILAYMHNDETGRCDPSVGYLARRCRLSQKQARRVLQNLEKKGAIRIRMRHSTKGDWTSNMYQIVPWGVRTLEGVPTPTGGSTPTDILGVPTPTPRLTKRKSNKDQEKEDEIKARLPHLSDIVASRKKRVSSK